MQMNKAFFFFFSGFILFGNLCLAQVPSTPDSVRVIEIISGRSLREKSIDSVNKVETIAGNVLIREGFTKFSCDSAIIDRQQNTIEAFGNVHINDADSLHTYAQYLKYIGNNRIAYLKRNVKLTDRKGTLLTEELEYDLSTGIGKYNNGGKVINGSTVLTSKEGIYYADTKDVYFRKNVDLVDPKYKIKADSLLYNTQTQVVTLIGPTEIKSKEANIFTTQGTYDLKTGNAFFGTRSLITDSSARIYQADRIAIDEKTGVAELDGSAVIKDSANGVIVTANHIFLNSRNNSFLATNKPVMIIQQEEDSIYISADTLFSGFTTKVNSEDPPQKKDSIISDTTIASSLLNKILKADTLDIIPDNDSIQINKLPSTVRRRDSLRMDTSLTNNPFNDTLRADTLLETARLNDSLQVDTVKGTKVIKLNKADTSIRYFLAFHNVRIFNDSLQSVCDSLFYSAQDSVFRLFRDPVVWSGQSQVTGDTIYLFTKNRKAERFYVFEKGMIVNKSENEFYNQIGGKTINGYLKLTLKYWHQEKFSFS